MGTIVIAGAGPSGMTAAITAARQQNGHRIILLEQKPEVGKKILVTGNGRCNFSNRSITRENYHSDDGYFLRDLLTRYSTKDDLVYFESLGIWTRARGDYLYPRCDQAAAVRDILLRELSRLNVQVKTSCRLKEISRSDKGFFLVCEPTDGEAGEFRLFADRLILSCGGKAASVHGSDGSGHRLAQALGHTIVPVVPGLVPLHIKKNPLKKASGVRTDASVSAYVDGVPCASDTGELQITDYGISGIPTFQISRFLARALSEHRTAEVTLDFLPHTSTEDVERIYRKQLQKNPNLTIFDCLRSVFPLKLERVLLSIAGIDEKERLGEITERSFLRLLETCKRLRLTVEKTHGFDAAQVCAGGVDTTQVDPATLQSRIVSGLYLTGELLDVDGVCGGYNLHWAWCSGQTAGRAAAEERA